MIRGQQPNHICAYCDVFSLKEAGQELVDAGMGRCMARLEGGFLSLNVPWDERACVSFRLDATTLAARKRFVAKQKGK